VNGGDIFVSYFKDGVWTKPVDDIKGLNTKYKEPSATISANRKTIYFSSDRPGGYGGLDIYRIDQDKDGNWSEPVNLGSVINTEYDEDGPFIAPDGKTLYFSSNGHNNMGGYDVFSSKFNPKTKKWQEPVNLGFPINSPNDDIYFVIAGDRRTAYYASAKKNGFGDKDIYEIELDTTYITQPLYVVEMGTNAPANLIAIKEGHPDFTSPLPIKNDKVEVPKSKLESLPENTTLYTGIIKEENTQKGTEAHIFVKKLNATDKPREYFANKDGTFEIPLSHGYKYAIDIEKEGYLFSSNTIDLTKPSKTRQLVSENFELKKIQTGQKMVMKNIFYETGSASLKPESFAEIDVLFDFMVKNPTVKIEISGHTDNVGKPEVNMELSISRARAIYKILVNRGIDPSRIKFVGYGSDKPIASNDTPEGRSKNRRTEFEIIQ
jgi:outer membrane protein OmpA-like peptidoglycan-associated protein